MNVLTTLLKENKSYFFYLFLTFGFFLKKGIEYAALNSYIPFIIIACICILFYFCLQSAATFNRFILFWSILLILWASTRILLSLMHHFINPLSESHVHYQLGIDGILLSITVWVVAAYLWSGRKHISRQHKNSVAIKK